MEGLEPKKQTQTANGDLGQEMAVEERQPKTQLPSQNRPDQRGQCRPAGSCNG